MYLVYGMTPEQFWDGDSILARQYKKAYELRRELKNEIDWIQGMYICDAVSYALFGRKAPYPSRPYTLNTAISKKRSKEEQQRIERENMLLEREKFLNWARKVNKRFEQKEQKEQKEKEKKKEKGGAT